VLGNHDHNFKKLRGLPNNYFAAISRSVESKINGRFFYLSHYQHVFWPESDRGSIHLFGHTHGSFPDDITSYTLDVGFDTSWYGHKQYTPYHIDELFDIMDHKKQYIKRSHHGGDN
jgi:calcineurin-like phosphoesterase family protein